MKQETEQENEQEQEAEQEREAELEHETFSGLKVFFLLLPSLFIFTGDASLMCLLKKTQYARDDYCEPWPFSALANMSSKVFYPASEFTVYGAGRIRPKPLSFPPFLMFSPNYYKPSWSNSSTHRRLKNVIMVMEWIPDTAKLGEELDEVERAARQAQQVGYICLVR